MSESKSDALPTWLIPNILVRVAGFEPAASCSQSRPSSRTDIHSVFLVEGRGIEPLTQPCKGHVFPLAPTPQICLWCEWWDSNPHAEAADFKSDVYADSTTLAYAILLGPGHGAGVASFSGKSAQLRTSAARTRRVRDCCEPDRKSTRLNSSHT